MRGQIHSSWQLSIFPSTCAQQPKSELRFTLVNESTKYILVKIGRPKHHISVESAFSLLNLDAALSFTTFTSICSRTFIPVFKASPS